MTTSDAVSVSILDKDYLIACPEAEREELMASARYLDERMRQTREGGKVLGTERLAVMTALNIVHEFLQQRKDKEKVERAIDESVKTLERKIAHALSRPDPVEELD